MDNQEKFILEFNNYAREVIEEHTVAIRNKYAKALKNSEERLQVFNEHLNALKEQLQNQMRETVQAAKTNVKDTGAIQTRLSSLYNNFINDFFKREF